MEPEHIRIEPTDPKTHAHNLLNNVQDLKERFRTDIHLVKDSKARALFETAAEVLAGIENTLYDYINESEEAWRSHEE